MVCLLSLLVGCSAVNKTAHVDDGLDYYKIKRIEQNDMIYYIDVVRNDSLFCIISPVKSSSSNLIDEIKEGESYPLRLFRIYPNNLIDRKSTEELDSYEGAGFLRPERKYHYSVYTARNLNGLEMSSADKTDDEIINMFGIRIIFCDACRPRHKLLLQIFCKE